MGPHSKMTDERAAPMRAVEAVSVAILAGGKSRRMGEDKALIRLLPSDKPLLSEVISRVGQLTDDLFVVASDRPEYAQFEVKIVADRCLDQGPLAGIATALTNSRHERCLVMSCDHPFLNVEFIRSMIATPGSWDALIPVTAGNSRQDLATIFHTLHAIYRRRCLVEIDASILAGVLRTTGFLKRIAVKNIPEIEVRAFDPELKSLFSVNSSKTLEIARAWRRSELGFDVNGKS